MLGMFFSVISIILIFVYIRINSDYEQYCTGIVGIFVEAFSDGKCSELEVSMMLSGIGSATCGLFGLVLIALGLTSNSSQIISNKPCNHCGAINHSSSINCVVCRKKIVVQNQSHVIVSPQFNSQHVSQPAHNTQNYQNTNQSIILNQSYKVCAYCGSANHQKSVNCASCKKKLP